MKKTIFLFLHFSLLTSIISAQYFTIDDIEFGRLTYLKPDLLRNLQWMGNSDSICYSRNDSLFACWVPEPKESFIVSLTSLKSSFNIPGLKSLTSFPKIVMLSRNYLYFSVDTTLVFLELISKDVNWVNIPQKAENIAVHPVTKMVAYTLGQNVFIQPLTEELIQVTDDTLDGIVNGDVVYRHEFGMETGIYWSPAGDYLAWYRKDETRVGKYPLVNIEYPIARVENIRYPMTGRASELTEVWIYSVTDGRKIKLQIHSNPDDYHTNLSWSPDEELIYLQHLNRNQDTMVLKCYSSQTGELRKTLFVETDPKYVEPLNPLIFSLKDPLNFLYQSECDGSNQIYFYDSSKKKLIQITKGHWEVTQVMGFDSNEENIFFMATKESPLERHFYKCNVSDKTITRLTDFKGTHEVKINKAGSFFIDSYSSTTVPHAINIYNAEGNLITGLLQSSNPLKDYLLGDLRVGTIRAADKKTKLYYRLTLPVHFDSTLKYPVIVYVYGGPHVQLITDSWLNRTDYLHQFYAQQGIVSFELDCRGSDYRGRDFEDVIHRQLGIPQLEDQYEGIKFLKNFSWIDTNRIGVEGWSFGGYMTIAMMVHYPEIFKVGVAGGPVTDWSYYEVMYGERYMDTPEQNPLGYLKTNVNLLASNLSGKLLVIHGAIDDVVVWQNSLVFLQECIEKGKLVDYFVYPREEHNVIGKERKHLTEMKTQYFLKNL